MKKSVLLIVTLFLIFFRVSFGDENSHADNFSDYINSPEGSSENAVNKSIDLNNATNDNPREQSDKADKGDRADNKPELQGIPAKWQACTMDSDCTAGVADCVSWEPLNKKYLHKLSKYLNSCSASIDPGFQPETVCAAKACKTTDKTTDVSWEEWLRERGINK